VQPRQFATSVFVCVEPENESGNNKPPVPTYAEIALFPETSGLAAKLGEPVATTNSVAIPRAKTQCDNLIFI
jgi:hypothetical protein